MLRSAAKDLGRLRRITRIIGKYGYDGFVRRAPELPPEVGSRDFEPESSPPPGLSGARRFRLMLEELGPTFIKFGQVLSARADLLAPAYIEELAQLQDHCEPLPFSEIEKALRIALGQDPGNCFERIDERPLATASIAQVHRGRLRSGQEVVVKVQRPGIRDEVRSDLDIMFRLARILDAVIEESQLAEPVGLVQEFEQGLLQELNFSNEAANIREFRQLHATRPDIVIPAVHAEFSTPSLLTLDFLDGVPFSRLPPDCDKPAIAKRIVREAIDELFTDGLFHGDPHPGNLMLLRDGRYGMLDFGLVGRLTPEMQETLVVLTLAIAVRDADTVARTLHRLGQSGRRVDIASVRRDVAMLLDRYLGRALRDLDSQHLLNELLDLAVRHGIRIPAEYALLGRAGATLEGVIRSLDPDLDVAEEARPLAEKLLRERVAPDNLQGGMYRMLLQLQGMQQEVPLQVSQILSDVSQGRLGVTVGGAELERLRRTVIAASTTVAGAILAGAFIIGSFIGMARLQWSVAGVPAVGLIGAAVGTAVLALLTGHVVVRPRLRRISVLRLWRARRRARDERGSQESRRAGSARDGAPQNPGLPGS